MILFDQIDYADIFYVGFAIVIFEISTQINFAYLRAKRVLNALCPNNGDDNDIAGRLQYRDCRKTYIWG